MFCSLRSLSGFLVKYLEQSAKTAKISFSPYINVDDGLKSATSKDRVNILIIGDISMLIVKQRYTLIRRVFSPDTLSEQKFSCLLISTKNKNATLFR